MSDDLNARQTIDLAYLMEAPPHAVYEWLRERAPENPHVDDIPEAFLEALHTRNEPLINLALAQWTTSGDLMKKLYADGDTPLRCAVLSNPQLGKVFWSLSSDFLLTEDEHRELALESDTRLLEAYLSNPSLKPELLKQLFERSGPFEGIEEERWQRALLLAAKNPVLHREYEYDRYGSSWEGLSGAFHAAPVMAAWSLLDSLPATREWAYILYELFSKMYYHLCPHDREEPEVEPEVESEEETGEDEGIWNSLERFRATYEPVEFNFFREVFSKWSSPEDEEERYWDDFGELRAVIASKAPTHHEALQEFLCDSEDAFVRKGYYRNFEPWKLEEVEAAFKKDGKEFVEAAIENRWFYRRRNKKVARALYNFVNYADALSETDREIIGPTYVHRGQHFAKENPTVYSFDEDELSRDPEDDEEEERRSLAGRSNLAVVGQRLGEVALAANKSDSSAWDSIQALKDSLEELEERLSENVGEIVRALGQRFEQQASAAKSNATLLFWALLIGFGLVLYFKN